MRGRDLRQGAMWSYVSAEERVPADHPLRLIREMTDVVLKDLTRVFTEIYSKEGRPSIPPEQLLRALLVQVLYSVRSERLLMEELNYNLLFRWFVGLGLDDRVWDASTFTKNRERLLKGKIAERFFEGVLNLARKEHLLSNEHFTVDGTLIEAWAGQKSFRMKGSKRGKDPDDPGNPTVDFHGEKRRNETHESTTDPEARLYRKSFGMESKLCFAAHVLMENRHGLAVDACVTEASSRSEREAGLSMARRLRRRCRATLGADKGYDTRGFVEAIRDLGITPHVAAKKAGYTSLDGRTTRHAGYDESQRKRKRIEEILGWAKTVGLLRKTRHRGKRRVGWVFRFTLAVYNLVRIRNLRLEAA